MVLIWNRRCLQIYDILTSARFSKIAYYSNGQLSNSRGLAVFLSLTGIARYNSDAPHDVVKNWLRSCETIEFLGLWESLHNPGFKQVEFDLFRSQAGLNAFTMSPTTWNIKL